MSSFTKPIPRVFVFALTIVLASVVLNGCSRDGSGGGATSGMSAKDLLTRGWDDFENHDYGSALESFIAAKDMDASLSDAWNGAGWTAGRMTGMLDEAAAYLATSFAIDTSRYDALAGLAFVVYQAGEWNSAIEKADSLLHRRPGWRFLHEPTLDFLDVRLMTAQAYYNLGDFERSYDVVVSYLNPSFETDITNALGRRQLLAEIERLRAIYG